MIRSAGLDPAGPQPFGDGVRCVGPAVVRLGASSSHTGVSRHVVGHADGPGTYSYQLWFRATPPSWCTPAAFNVSSGRALVW